MYVMVCQYCIKQYTVKTSGSGCVAPPYILNLSTKCEVGGQPHTPVVLYWMKVITVHCLGGQVGPRAGLDQFLLMYFPYLPNSCTLNTYCKAWRA